MRYTGKGRYTGERYFEWPVSGALRVVQRERNGPDEGSFRFLCCLQCPEGWRQPPQQRRYCEGWRGRERPRRVDSLRQRFLPAGEGIRYCEGYVEQVCLDGPLSIMSMNVSGGEEGVLPAGFQFDGAFTFAGTLRTSTSMPKATS